MQEISQVWQLGIGITTTTYVMYLAHCRHRSAERYKAIINVGGSSKNDKYREAHPDQCYYLFLHVAYRHEFAQTFSNRWHSFMWWHEQNQVKPLRYKQMHQISTCFTTNDQPQYLHYDFLHPDYFLIPTGSTQFLPQMKHHNMISPWSQWEWAHLPTCWIDRSSPTCTCFSSACATTLSIGAALIIATSKIACVGGGPVMVSETACTICTLTETEETINKSSSLVLKPTASTAVGSRNPGQPGFKVDKLGQRTFNVHTWALQKLHIIQTDFTPLAFKLIPTT